MSILILVIKLRSEASFQERMKRLKDYTLDCSQDEPLSGNLKKTFYWVSLEAAKIANKYFPLHVLLMIRNRWKFCNVKIFFLVQSLPQEEETGHNHDKNLVYLPLHILKTCENIQRNTISVDRGKFSHWLYWKHVKNVSGISKFSLVIKSVPFLWLQHTW